MKCSTHGALPIRCIGTRLTINIGLPCEACSMNKGFWVLTRYQDVFEVSRDQERFSSHDEGFLVWDLDSEQLAQQRANFMGMRPAEHSAVKRSLVPPFSPKAMDAMAPEVERLAKEVVDDVAGVEIASSSTRSRRSCRSTPSAN